MGTSHDNVANRIARQQGVPYNRGKGPDVKGGRATVEVETENTVKDGLRQLQGYRGPVYIAGASSTAVQRALKATDGTTIGVMTPNGRIVKPSTRKK